MRGKNEPEQTAASQLVAPYGGGLVDLVVPAECADEVKAFASTLSSIQISDRLSCDLELLAIGAFSPLDRFMGAADYRRVLDEMRLANGLIYPMPVTLPVNPDDSPLSLDQEIALRNAKNEILAVMTVEEVYAWDPAEEAHKVCATQDMRHPFVAGLHRLGRLNISGRLRVLQLPRHYDFHDLRLTPSQARARLQAFGRSNVVAFQAPHPLHRAYEALTKRAIDELDGVLLLRPVVGMVRPGDVNHFTRVRSCKVLAERYYDPDRILLSLLPLATRLAGPREAVWHALMDRNYGASHFVVGPDHASPGPDSQGQPFYGPYEAQALAEDLAGEMGMRIVPFREFVFLRDEGRYEEATKVPAHAATASLSGMQVREEYLNNGHSLPAWFARPEVADILAETHPPRHRQGVCVWFTGLSGAGKSTTAEVLTVLLLEHGRQVTVLDGDVVRTHLSKGLGFSKEDRDINIRRIGFVAAEIVRHGGIVICAAVSPYRAARNDARSLVGSERFVEVYVDTPLEVCEQRDVKGMYAKARRGEIKGFTAVDDPYEPPLQAEVRIETVNSSPEANAWQILSYLVEDGFIRKMSAAPALPLPVDGHRQPGSPMARREYQPAANSGA
jgi:sulfate adenylyltransferase